jgi:hypothetical protein
MANVIYFANPAGAAAEAMIAGRLGFIDTPEQGNKRPEGVIWCADNGKFSRSRAEKGIPWDEEGWWRFLVKHAGDADSCAFATAPDVVNWVRNEKGDLVPVGDAAATLIESARWYDKMHELGFKVALVAQDGLDPDDVPWDKIDAIFVGGSDDYKVGTAPPPRVRALRADGSPWGRPGCIDVVREARRRGKWVHVGRVNSLCRYRFACLIGADSVDGTYLVKAPDENLPKLMSWLDEPFAVGPRSDYALAA